VEENAEREKKLTIVFGGASFLIALVIYLITMAPTVSFWDCGEFIACSQILGIPHPPGTPLFILIGRFFSLMLGFIPEIAARINLISCLSSTVTVFICYLVLLHVCQYFLQSEKDAEKEKTLTTQLIPHVSAFAGALLIGLADTFWFNAVEAEVYGLAMLEMGFAIWLILKWRRVRETAWGDRIILLVIYISFLGIGNHLYSMLITPVLLLYVVMVDEEKRKNWPFLLTGSAVSTVILSLWNILWIGPILLLVSGIFLLFKRETARAVNAVFSLGVIVVLFAKWGGYSLDLYSFFVKKPGVSFGITEAFMIFVLAATPVYQIFVQNDK